MSCPHIMQPNSSGKDSWAFHREMIVKQLYLNVRPEDGIVSMCNRIHD